MTKVDENINIQRGTHGTHVDPKIGWRPAHKVDGRRGSYLLCFLLVSLI